MVVLVRATRQPCALLLMLLMRWRRPDKGGVAALAARLQSPRHRPLHERQPEVCELSHLHPPEPEAVGDRDPPRRDEQATRWGDAQR
jgi:hypothetical protein